MKLIKPALRCAVMLLIGLFLVVCIRQYIVKYDTRKVPVLMLHSVTTEPEGEWSITTDNLREDIQYIRQQGYTIVSLKQVIDFESQGKTIPEKCVCLTFDDGYYDNYSNLLPLLEELQAPATIFVIISSMLPEGEEPPDDGSLYWVTLEQMRQLNDSEWIDVQSHTYNMHSETIDPDSGKTRTYILPVEGETEEHYREVLRQDYEAADSVLKEAGIENQFALAYPHGEGYIMAEQFLREQGIQLTLTTDYGHENIVRVYRSDTLYNLGRMNVNNDTTKEELMEYLTR